MSNEVYANTMEVACKAAAGKAICAMPDVCMTPPQTPATPPGVPVPYPNTGMASDCSDGSSTVAISGQEIMLKDKSYFKTSTGDEGGCAPMKSVITSTNKGKVYFNAWSMDVMVEGENVVRHLDLTTHNHASKPGATPPWPYTDLMTAAQIKLCAKDRRKENNACRGLVVKDDRKATEDKMCADTKQARKCQKARQCMLVPYKPDKDGKKEIGCCPAGTGLARTGHHVLPKSSFKGMAGWSKYDKDRAPCVCAEGHSYYDGTHGDLHTRYGVVAMKRKDAKGNWPSRSEATTAGAKSIKKTFPASNCSQKCLEAQLNAYHDSVAPDPEKPIKATHPMATNEKLSDEGRLTRDEAAQEMGVPQGSTR